MESLFELEKEVFAVPLSHTLSVESVKSDAIHEVVGAGLVMGYQEETISVISLRDLFRAEQNNQLMSLG
ncbi:MAG: hypothetical protein JKY52_18535 [Flavobacteriales bacterium]|nr:hypothetical protein [Flavobacteriales bacterium]